jgi:glycosyltransferase involved in cell wall biosynthesis
MIRVAVINSHPVQYQVPFFRALNAEPDFDVTVFYASEYGIDPKKVHPGFNRAIAWDIPLLGGYNHHFLQRASVQAGVNDWYLDAPGLRKHLADGEFDLLLVLGWNKVMFWQAILWGKLYGIPLMLRAESNLKQRKPFFVRLLKKLLFPLLFRSFSSFLAIGTFNREMYLRFGVPEQKITTALYAVDNLFFKRRTDEERDSAAAIRKDLGIGNDATVFLYVAKLIDRKRPMDLIEVFKTNESLANCHMIFVGDGPLIGMIKQQIDQFELINVHLVGFKNQTELPSYYAAANTLILPSEYETWGLVINEAMGAGLNCVATDTCGATIDIIKPLSEQFVYSPGDCGRLAEILLQIDSQVEGVELLGRQAQEFIEAHASIEKLVIAFKKSAGSVLSK